MQNIKKEKKVSRRVADLLCLAVAVIWGTGFIFTQIAIDANMGPALIMAIRFVVGALAVFLLAAKKIKTITKADILHGSIAGVFLFGGFTTQLMGQMRTTVSNTAFLTATNVVIVPFLVWIFSKKRPSPKIFVSAVITLAGIGVLSYNGAGGFQIGAGDALVLLCAIFFALHIFYTGHAVKGRAALLISFIQLAVAAVLSIIMLLFFGAQAFAGVDIAKGLGAVLYLGVFSSGICFFMQSYAQKYTSQSRAGILLSTEGLFGSMFSVLLGMEKLTLSLIIGGLLIFASLVLLELPLQGKR